MRFSGLFLTGCLFAALTPLWPSSSGPNSDRLQFGGWPASHEGRPLQRVALTERETRFADGFPGRIAKFKDGNRVIIVRWLTQPTRKLHPAVDCFKGNGCSAHPLPLRTDTAGRIWGCFEAAAKGESFFVSERIHDEAGNGWTDASAWYWAALLGRTHGPWWAFTVVDANASAVR